MVMMLKPRCNRRSGWGKGLLDQKKPNESVKDQSVEGTVFFHPKALFIMRFVLGGQMANEQMYQKILARLGNAERRKRPEIWESHTLILHHD